MATGSGKERGPRVGLMATCLVDLFRPSTGFAAARLLQKAGCRVEVPVEQTCCGQPAYNSGDRERARVLARRVIEQFEGYDYLVLPSGSCAGMIRVHYPGLFEPDDPWHPRARALAAKTHELVSFLAEVRGVGRVRGRLDAKLAYHDSCSGLRELNVKQQPRKLLAGVEGLRLEEMEDAEVCCGFGGTFCVKYPDLSNAIVSDKAAKIAATGAGTLLGGDMGCLMNMAGKLQRLGAQVEVRHVAEVLADMTDQPAIGESPDEAARRRA